jgi:hypothetical protein
VRSRRDRSPQGFEITEERCDTVPGKTLKAYQSSRLAESDHQPTEQQAALRRFQLVHAHGPIALESISSGTKRIVGQIRNVRLRPD